MSGLKTALTGFWPLTQLEIALMMTLGSLLSSAFALVPKGAKVIIGAAAAASRFIPPIML
jgi:hypothetical protein